MTTALPPASGPTSATDLPAPRSRPVQITMRAALLVGATLAGLGAGVATSYAQGLLPGEWFQVANSGAVWTVVAFVVAVICSRSRHLAVAAGTLALVAEVLGFYLIAAAAREIPTTRAETVLWTIAALWVGPAAGFAGWCTTHGDALQRLAATLAVAGLLAGEGLYEVRRVGSDLFGRTELWVAFTIALAGVLYIRSGWQGRLVGIGVGAIVASSIYALYSQTILL